MKSDEIAIKTKIVAVDIMHNYPVLLVSLTIHPFFHKEGDEKKIPHRVGEIGKLTFVVYSNTGALLYTILCLRYIIITPSVSIHR